MVFKPYLVLKEGILVRLKNHTRQLEDGMRKVCWIDCQRRENFEINKYKTRNPEMTGWFYGIILFAWLEMF